MDLALKCMVFAQELIEFVQKFIAFNKKNWFNTRMHGVPTEKIDLALKWMVSAQELIDFVHKFIVFNKNAWSYKNAWSSNKKMDLAIKWMVFVQKMFSVHFGTLYNS